MHERIVEILLLLMNELQANKQLGDIDVSSLARQGYTPTEISSAFSWLFDRLQNPQTPALKAGKADPLSHRMLHPAELSVLTPEGHGYLLQCHQLGLLSTSDMETVIERIMMAGFSSAGEEEVKSLIAGLLFDVDRTAGGSVPSLGPSDTIH
ncbi:MAG: hypothetical protein A2X67_04495 [Ignavibacteria bacterium GWA2_55_11]|nr:MAG: hypothetical protein A2X67_04495 [Ignavibacteria bacterium GWA2_55_11]OGU43590.1 MAG: hypothetical protein A2X68_06185 [Ignavibacteria bacterium GWC2_56_12]OGU68735.1 MAG: hypothetical protein A3C56_03660 [Ignavibacteria bacterium RIFCSPHIGHO2_02_FULL_56_12]OGU68920.1 MAG: hypothetical protein A3H45_00520 [Ignavibacteria bacterium RIFCSPLOWO2_02_FULL_55_14]OGU72753.1 MAG: hypothetical protein A3G43_10340 [Ignavibacteria bacterium RIFCSPLOWO2_12_FULL_56_21]HAV22250.1 hypothetical protei